MTRWLSAVGLFLLAIVLTIGLSACSRDTEDADDGGAADDTSQAVHATDDVAVPPEPRSSDVVIYVSVDRQIAEPILRAFEDQTGIRVRESYDTEATKTTGLVARLRDEHAQGRSVADVFWSSEAFMTIQLADEGVLTPITAEMDHEPAWGGARRMWYGFAARPRVLAYVPDRVDQADLPERWLDLLHPRFAGRLAMADPRFGTTRGHVAAFFHVYGEATATRFLHGLDANDLLIVDGNSLAVRRLVEGEVDFAITDSDDVWAAKRQGADIEMLYLRHTDLAGGGTLVIPNTVARVAGGPNGDVANDLIVYLLSEGVERLLAESDSHNIPSHPALRAQFAQYAVPDPLDIDLAEVAAMMDRVIETASDVLGTR
ncbi:MAG: extracellular solute-binding protein [Phycisphaerales bacterium]|nr:extracellular solute-binding protein [Phycisphaerales bacterium]